ncbi:hypothetical protein D3C72_1446550 [compost metagenome]
MITCFLWQLRYRFEVVANLRQQAADIDRVGRVQVQRFFQLLIVKRLLDQGLAGIEVAINRHGVNVAAQGTEQLFLQRADFALRVKDHHANILQAVESMCHRRAGIAGSRRQDSHRLIACHFRQHLRHKAAAEVFERQRRAVEQLQARDVVFHLRHRCREFKGRRYALMQSLFGNFIANKRRQDAAAAGDKILLQQMIDFGQFKFRQFQREKQPLLFAQALFDRLREADLLVVILKVVQFHALSQ